MTLLYRNGPPPAAVLRHPSAALPNKWAKASSILADLALY